jgi:hypothetical protein
VNGAGVIVGRLGCHGRAPARDGAPSLPRDAGAWLPVNIGTKRTGLERATRRAAADGFTAGTASGSARMRTT